ncbi:MAG: hypothetical protein KAS32_18575 [Candidatus Peribacteraceae bacterium]|nr:hypothetical protein [Candidatus Peribacteraceae bacterium]
MMGNIRVKGHTRKIGKNKIYVKQHTKVKRVKFVDRFNRINGVVKAIYILKNLHLTIFYKEGLDRQTIRDRVMRVLYDSNLEQSVETISLYEE